MKHLTLNLRLFDGEPAAQAEVAQNGTQAETAVENTPKETETKVVVNTVEARKAEFEKLIKGEYKDLYNDRVKTAINQRFKQTKTLEEQVNSFSPVLDMLASKYGVDARDVKALAKAIEEDDSYYADEAMKKGLTVEQLKQIKKLERENANLKRAADELEKQKNAELVYAKWLDESEKLRAKYPNFDLKAECENPETGQRFVELLESRIDVETAYKVVHMDDIMGGAMQYTAQQVQQKVVNDIKARGLRPDENGTSGSAPAVATKKDPSKLSDKELDEISRRVRQGDIITFRD
jgi:uncharacterized protein YajQ (UPF0234 family)